MVPAGAATAFALAADPREHPGWVPLTRVRTEGDWANGPAVGALFVAVTGPGARRGGPGVVDRMRIVRWVAPAAGPGGVGSARFVKRGPLLLGEAGIDVVPLGPGRARVTWWEETYLAGPFPRALTAALTAPVTAVLLGVSLPRLRRAAGAGRDPRLTT